MTLLLLSLVTALLIVGWVIVATHSRDNRFDLAAAI